MIGVDWGTTNLRAFRLAGDGTVLAELAMPCGILHVGADGFAAALHTAIDPWLAEGERRVLLCGMIGSRQGWVEAPYLPCPAGAAELAAALMSVPFAAAEVRLVPGLAMHAPESDIGAAPEVMRGEETQLVGLFHTGEFPTGDGLVCLPGSHSKWARIASGQIVGFQTYLTGEAFAALRDGTILGRMMRRDGTIDRAGFDRGVARAAAAGHLLHHLFGVRTLALFGELSEAAGAGYLSGLLIGHEVRAAMPARDQTVHLAGEAALCALYARAIAAAGGRAVIADSAAAARGLARIGREAGWI